MVKEVLLDRGGQQPYKDAYIQMGAIYWSEMVVHAVQNTAKERGKCGKSS